MEEIERAYRHAIRAAGCRKMIERDPRSATVWKLTADAEEMKMRLACGRAAKSPLDPKAEGQVVRGRNGRAS